MSDTRKRIHEMIDGIEKRGVLEYLETFISLFLEKWG